MFDELVCELIIPYKGYNNFDCEKLAVKYHKYILGLRQAFDTSKELYINGKESWNLETVKHWCQYELR